MTGHSSTRNRPPRLPNLEWWATSARREPYREDLDELLLHVKAVVEVPARAEEQAADHAAKSTVMLNFDSKPGMFEQQITSVLDLAE